MGRVVALLAAVLALAASGCGEDGAEPGVSQEATLVLDFTPNAVHSGIYAALAEGDYADAGIELEVREPGASTDAPKLLEARRTDFAIMDINDLGIARTRGLDVVAIAPIARLPLAAVIAADAGLVRRPADLAGRTVGVTGLPSDDAVLDAVVAGDGGDPAEVDRVNIGFDAVAALSAGRVDAATAFWNAEGVQLRELGLDTREFRVSDYVRAAYPELVLVAARETLRSEPALASGMEQATSEGYSRVARSPNVGLEALLEQVPGLEREAVAPQLEALIEARAFALEPGPFRGLEAWADFAAEGGIVEPAEARETVRDGFVVP